MKQNIHLWALLIFTLFLITFSGTSARFLATCKHGKEGLNLSNINSQEGSSLVDKDNNHSFDKLMGMENCGNEDEECLTRRVIAEANLDYIYTQHHRP